MKNLMIIENKEIMNIKYYSKVIRFKRRIYQSIDRKFSSGYFFHKFTKGLSI